MLSAVGRVLQPRTHVPIPVGGACLIAPDLVLTCAHVVQYATDPPPAEGGAEGTTVALDFPWSREARRVSARVITYLPRRGPKDGDLALLRLDTSHTEEALLPSLGTPSEGNRVAACGFPADSSDGAAGQWAYGVVQNARVDGWVQVTDTTSTGYWVKQGFSGAPVWDYNHESAVGIAAAFEMDPTRRVAYVISMARALRELAASNPAVAELHELGQRFVVDREGELVEKSKGYASGVVLRELAMMLAQGEKIVHLLSCSVGWLPASGLYSGGVLAITDRRIVFLTKVAPFPAFVRQWSYDEVRVFQFRPFGVKAPLGDTIRIRSRKRRLDLIELDPEGSVNAIEGSVNAIVEYVTARRTELHRIASA